MDIGKNGNNNLHPIWPPLNYIAGNKKKKKKQWKVCKPIEAEWKWNQNKNQEWNWKC